MERKGAIGAPEWYKEGRGIPVMITTFPAALGPLEGPATFFSFGIPSKVPWSGIGATSCSLSADSRRLAVAADTFLDMVSRFEIGEEGMKKLWGE